ncbi:PTS lactose/cellobiose transporter subunit IIA [Lentibacillus sp. L22]|uniref:PTS lactose/cellobiose transporter subunit IIA n=1 Tax=Lentibacillus TaxID=175304 RepID=UPI0022B18304|nr:PTS lactose/cellobiose transporter subunit IIA [Lentibacillus daqui]
MSEEVVFQIILHAGNARSLAMEAISLAKNNDIDGAKQRLEDAKKEILDAHETQTEFIQKESRGEKTDVTLLLVHAQDHFMNAVAVKDLAIEFVDLYEKLDLTGEVKPS